MSGEPEFLAVGKLRRPHGVHGEMLMAVWTDFPERLQPGGRGYLGTKHSPAQISRLRTHAQGLLVAFAEFDDRESAGTLRNQVVFVRREDLPPLPDGEFYLHQLLGLDVVRDVDSVPLGYVAEILETGANDVFLVRREMGADLLLPDIDSVILKIDLENNEMRVHLLPGLLQDDSV